MKSISNVAKPQLKSEKSVLFTTIIWIAFGNEVLSTTKLISSPGRATRSLLRKIFFRLLTSMGQKKFWVPTRNWTSELWISHSDALPKSHTAQRLHGEGGLLRSSYDTQIVFRNEYYLAYFPLILNSKRSISVRMKRKISLLDNFETSRLNSTRYFSQSETTYVMLWMHGWAYVSIFTAVAP